MSYTLTLHIQALYCNLITEMPLWPILTNYNTFNCYDENEKLSTPIHTHTLLC